MVVHVVLFQPRADLTDRGRHDILAGLSAAAARIPSIRRFRVGRRVRHGLPGYEQAMREPYDYAAIIEFDDLDGLRGYLADPAHLGLGAHFTESAAASLAYDYEMVDARDAAGLADA
jgi:hypothetical protein